jgi:hypothetical protein
VPSLLLATRTEARRWCSLRASTCWQMDVRSRSLTGLLRGTVMMGSLERIRCSLRDLFGCHETFPYPWHILQRVGIARHALHFYVFSSFRLRYLISNAYVLPRAAISQESYHSAGDLPRNFSYENSPTISAVLSTFS